MNEKNDTKTSTVITVLLIFPLVLGFFVFMAYYWSSTEKNLPKIITSDTNTALRGDIISQDGYTLANSQKLYKVMIDTRSIDPDKTRLFVKLYCIYTGDDEQKISKKIASTKGTLVLSYSIDSKTAVHLKELARTLTQKKVFISFGKSNAPIGMSIIESGEKRDYIAGESFTPTTGYVKKIEANEITKISGVKGIEKYYDYYLSPIQDAKIIGPRDVGFNIILEKKSQKSKRIDGYNLILSVPLKLQKNIEALLDKSREKLDAKEVIAAVIDSKTGRVLSLASSNRYDPAHIKKQDYDALNSTATEYAYEMGSVMKPIVFSQLLELKRIKLDEMIKTYNGAYKLGKNTIKDSHGAPFFSAQDIIVHSSNIGMIILSQRLNGMELYQGLVNFGLSKKTNIDMPYEQVGVLPGLSELNGEIYRATVSYGYGLQATFLQLMSAYTAFNNDGVIISPRVVSALERDGKFFAINPAQKHVAISKSTADTVKDVLIKTVEKGTGKRAITPGIIVGGKTGTAAISREGKGYGVGGERVYNATFLGFANDEHNASYTIGVLVRQPSKPAHYYAAQSALPVFKQIVDTLVEQGFLVKKAVDESAIKINISDEIIRD